MQRASLACQALMAVVYLMGCGSGDDSGTSPPFVGAAETPSPVGDTPADPSSPDSEVPPGDTAAGNEGQNPDLGLDPSDPAAPTDGTPPEVAPEVPVEEIDPNNGRLVGGSCTLVCSSDATDADAQGVLDGWGYESSRSCITPESQMALTGAL